VRVACPGCGAEESRCREALPECRHLAADRRRLYAAANGSEVESLRAENEDLRAQLALIGRLRDWSYSYSIQDHRPKPPAPGRPTEIP
jgi:hypothetical protein